MRDSAINARRVHIRHASGFLLALLLALVAVTAVAAPPQPLLWRVSGTHGTIYLLGSFHMLSADDYPLAPAVESAYAQADKLVFEISPELADSPGMGLQMMQRAMLPAGTELADVISSDTAGKLRAHIGNDAAYAAMARFKPWFINVGLAIRAMQGAGLDPALGLDQYFMQRARTDKKGSSGLEGIEEQLRAFDAAPMNEQELSLREALRPQSELQDDVRELHRAWRDADLAALEQIQREEFFEKTPVTGKLVLTDRNQNWLPQMQAMLAQPHTTLVVVGALHLVGDAGMPALLAEAGWQVERLR